MEALLDFELRQPDSAQGVVAELAASPGSRLLAGGTDLLPNLRRGLEQPAVVVSLHRVDGLAGIDVGADGAVVGARATLDRIAVHDGIVGGYRALAEAAAAVAGPGHRSAATLGGNLCQDTRCVYYNQSAWWRAANDYCLKRGGTVCHVAPTGHRCNAAYCSDVAPALLALGAEAELLSPRGARRVPLAELFRDDGAAHLALAADELLLRVHVPAPAAGARSGYRKGRVRGAMDFALAGVAVSYTPAGNAAGALRVALTGTDSRPLLLDGTDALLGKPVDDACLAALGRLVARQVGPARTTVTPSNHRRLVASTLAQRLLRELALA